MIDDFFRGFRPPGRVTDLYFSLAGKVPKVHIRGEGFRFPSPLMYPHTLKRHKEGRNPSLDSPRQPFGYPVYCYQTPEVLHQVFSATRHSKAKAEILKFVPQKRASGAKDSRFANLVPQTAVRGPLGTPVKIGDAKGCPLGGFLVTFVPIQK